MCFNGPKWKREVIPDHKFDFVDVRDFHSKAFAVRMRYIWMYVLVLKSFMVYVSDIFTAVTMLTSEEWSNSIFESCPQNETNGCVFIPFKIAKWLFVGCIIFSFLLLAYETRKTKKIIASRDISYAFTNVTANYYYSLRSYDHFCFFCHINDSTKTLDNFAFFIFFTFKEWKRLLLADGPRQAINGLTLYAIYLARPNTVAWYDLPKYTSGSLVTTGLLVSTLFTVTVFAGSLLLLLAAGVLYIPLLCYIRGNLKEYCCHKVDKRISEIIKRKAKQRLQENAALAKKEAAGDFSHYRNKKGEMVGAPLPQPTLPNISLDDESEPPYWQGDQKSDFKVDHKSQYEASVYSGRGAPEYAMDYPPMPMYPFQQGYAGSAQSLPGEGSAYEGGSVYEYDQLAYGSAPMGQGGMPNPYSPPAANAQYDHAPYEAQPPYPGRAPSAAPTYTSEPPSQRRRTPGPNDYYGPR